MTRTPRLVGALGLAATALILAAPNVEGAAGTAGWIAGIVLLLPFLSGLGSELAPSSRWLTPVMAASAAAVVTLQLVTLGVAHAAGSVDQDSVVHQPLHTVESALFGLALIPLGVAIGAAAVAIVRHRGLPRWFGYPTGLVALGLLANGSQLGTEEMPALLLFLAWALVASVMLLVRRSAAVAPVAPVAVAATAA